MSEAPGDDLHRGVKLLHDPIWNKGTAFTEEERDVLGLRGLLPPQVDTQALQMARVLEHLETKASDLERYIALIGLQDRNETLFYRLVIDHLEKMLPLVYTPTVGLACQHYGHIFRRPRGLFVSAADRGRIAELLRNWPHRDVRIVVVTDGGRILGLGDLGANGMGIPIGKLTLYSACAGVAPTQCLPIMLDVGTNNEALLQDPLYLGTRTRRLVGAPYEELVDELMIALVEAYPQVVVQLEDFATTNAFSLLRRYADRFCVFDDDIQGTAAVVLAGLLAAQRLAGHPLEKGRYLFVGAGQAGLGIADLLVTTLMAHGLSREAARARCWFVDSRGLVTSTRRHVNELKRPYAHDLPEDDDLTSIVQASRPAVIIGSSGQGGLFTREVIEAMARVNDKPIVLALSNPTAKAECTAEQAYAFSEGRAIFASGSPFPPVERAGRLLVPGQGNNAYVFPGVGLGAIACQAAHVTDEMFAAAAHALARRVTEADLGVGRVYPPLTTIREISLDIAVAVAEVAYARGLARVPESTDLRASIRRMMFEPDYASLIGGAAGGGGHGTGGFCNE